jgi:hypothetical protein
VCSFQFYDRLVGVLGAGVAAVGAPGSGAGALGLGKEAASSGAGAPPGAASSRAAGAGPPGVAVASSGRGLRRREEEFGGGRVDQFDRYKGGKRQDL